MDFDSYVQPIIDFVRVHSVWAAPVVFVLCFAESLAFISLLIPAWAALVGIGTLIGASELNFWPIWIAGSIGAALGDWVSYWIGLKLEKRVYHMWPLSRNPEMIPKGEEFVQEVGPGARSSSAGSPGRCAPRCRSSPASSPCRTGASRSPISPRPSCGAAVLLTLGDVTSKLIKWIGGLLA